MQPRVRVHTPARVRASTQERVHACVGRLLLSVCVRALPQQHETGAAEGGGLLSSLLARVVWHPSPEQSRRQPQVRTRPWESSEERRGQPGRFYCRQLWELVPPTQTGGWGSPRHWGPSQPPSEGSCLGTEAGLLWVTRAVTVAAEELARGRGDMGPSFSPVAPAPAPAWAARTGP